MSERFQNRYRIESSRLQTWDYAKAAKYFITICTKNREHYFGEIVNRKMQLSPAGVIADILWYEIKNHAENVDLGQFMVMPNHIHGILILNGVCVDGDAQLNVSANCDTNDGNRGTAMGTVGGDTVGIERSIVETRHALSLPLSGSPLPNSPLPEPQLQPPFPSAQSNQPPKTIGQQRFRNQGKNTVSSIVGSYKSAVTKPCHRLGLEFGWQSRFYDIIIRDSPSFERIQRYISDNPANWREDKFSPG